MTSSNQILPNTADGATRLVNGTGATAASQTALQTLRRLTCACLLWEEVGSQSMKDIAEQIPLCPPQAVADLAIEIRTKQNLRKVPLLLIRELFRLPHARIIAGTALPKVILRPDEIAAFLNLYYEGSSRTQPLANQVKKGLSEAFKKFDEYQLAKYKNAGKKDGKGWTIRDAMFMAHVKPNGITGKGSDKRGRKLMQDLGLPIAQTPSEALYAKVANQELATPETRETMLSAAQSPTQQKEGFEAMLKVPGKLGTTALLKSLAKMAQVGVSTNLISEAIVKARADRIVPLDFVAAYNAAPQFIRPLETLMASCMAKYTRLPGKTYCLLDVSGSMGNPLAGRDSQFKRMDAAIALAIMLGYVCEDLEIWLTAGSDGYRKHQTELYKGSRGLQMYQEVQPLIPRLGGGGIFTRQALEFLRGKVQNFGERTLVISDSQDCDVYNSVPAPFSPKNYVIDISSEKHGINYAGVWTAEIVGWSQMFVEYIAQLEALSFQYSLF